MGPVGGGGAIDKIRIFSFTGLPTKIILQRQPFKYFSELIHRIIVHCSSLFISFRFHIDHYHSLLGALSSSFNFF